MQNRSRFTLLMSAITLGLILTIFIESSQPPLEIIAQTPGLDKVAHFITFGILAMLIYLTITLLNANKWRSAFTITLLLSAIIGLSDECYQLLNPERAFDLFDFAADILGALCFVSLLKWWHGYHAGSTWKV